jgi:hypothetical protein
MTALIRKPLFIPPHMDEPSTPCFYVECETDIPTSTKHKRRKRESKSVQCVSPLMVKVSGLLRTLAGSQRNPVPITLSTSKWNDVCDFLSEEKRKRIYKQNWNTLYRLTHMLPSFSYLQMDASIMNCIGDMIMQLLRVNIGTKQMLFGELILIIQQYLSPHHLLSGNKKATFNRLLKMDYRVLSLIHKDWKAWMPEEPESVFLDDVEKQSPFLQLLFEYIVDADAEDSDTDTDGSYFYSNEVFFTYIHLKSDIEDYCRMYCKKDASLEEFKNNMEQKLVRYQFTEEERLSFWQKLEQLAIEKQTEAGESKSKDPITVMDADMTSLLDMIHSVQHREWVRVHLGPLEHSTVPLFHTKDALYRFVNGASFGILDVLGYKPYLHCDPVHVDAPDQVIPSSQELPWEIHICEREVLMKHAEEAELASLNPAAKKFMPVIQRLVRSVV